MSKSPRNSSSENDMDQPPPYSKKPMCPLWRGILVGVVVIALLVTVVLVLVYFVDFNSQGDVGDLDPPSPDPPSPERADIVGLGRSFYLPNTKLLGDIGGGTKVFKKFNQDCIKARKSSTNKIETAYFERTESLMSKIGTETGISGKVPASGFTLGVSIQAATNSVDKQDMNIKGFSLDAKSYDQDWEFNQDCLKSEKLSSEVREAFENLPAAITEPHRRKSWEDYSIFLQKFGSHIAKRITLGSRYTRYIFSKSTEQMQHSDFTIKVCAKVKHAKNFAQLCQNYTDEDYSRVANFQTQETTTVRGGSDEVRAELVVQLTDNLLTSFLKESNLTDQAVAYQYQSMWEMLKGRYQYDTKHFAKAVNLEAYYLGYLNADCSHLDNGDGVDLRRFEQVGTAASHPEYACKLAPIGCRKEKDCQGRSDLVCHCYGDSCVEKLEQDGPKFSVKESRYVRKEYDGDKGKSEGANESCYLSLTTCKCKKLSDIWTTVWSSDAARSRKKPAELVNKE